MANSEPVRVVVFKGHEQWVAQCLEYDICAQASDLDTLRDRVEATLAAEHQHRLNKGGLSSLPKAPDHFFRMWEKRSNFDKSGSLDGVNYEMALCA